MNNLFKPSWWVSIFVSTFFTMCIMLIIKKATARFDIPIVSDIAQSV